ncbi:MAG TPA: histidine phosphatase family protein [Mycobacterium sp.]|nr:histidine phosphatase family protein [Mycobacterium sp.]
MTAVVTRVYLARHGRTALNAEGRLRGLSDPPLDEVGIAEVAGLADVLAAKHPMVVVCTPPAAGGRHRASDRHGSGRPGQNRCPAQ